MQALLWIWVSIVIDVLNAEEPVWRDAIFQQGHGHTSTIVLGVEPLQFIAEVMARLDLVEAFKNENIGVQKFLVVKIS